MLKNRGAAAALVGLTGIVAVGFSFFDRPHCYKSQDACIGQHQHASTNNKFPNPFILIGKWASDNREAIEPLSAIASLGFAAALAFFTATLWRATSKLAASTAELSVAERANSDELRKASDLAEKQFILAGESKDLAARQHGLERKKLLTENRPRLGIRSLSLARTAEGTLFEEGQFITGSLVIVNKGGIDATIVESGYRFFISSHGLPMTPPINGPEMREMYLPVKDPIAGFGSCLIPIKSDKILDCHGTNITAGRIQLYIMGFIGYSDWDGVKRFTGSVSASFVRQSQNPKDRSGQSTTQTTSMRIRICLTEKENRLIGSLPGQDASHWARISGQDRMTPVPSRRPRKAQRAEASRVANRITGLG